MLPSRAGGLGSRRKRGGVFERIRDRRPGGDLDLERETERTEGDRESG